MADAEPIPDQEEIFVKLICDKYFTKIDLIAKGYWQVPLTNNAQKLTAFVTSNSLFEFSTMPFGYVNTQASFSRIMRYLIRGLSNVDNFTDDVLIHTARFEEHNSHSQGSVRKAGEGEPDGKTKQAFHWVQEYRILGHCVGQGEL